MYLLLYNFPNIDRVSPIQVTVLVVLRRFIHSMCEYRRVYAMQKSSWENIISVFFIHNFPDIDRVSPIHVNMFVVLSRLIHSMCEYFKRRDLRHGKTDRGENNQCSFFSPTILQT